MTLPHPNLRKVRMDTVPSAKVADGVPALTPGEWFVEQHTAVVKVFGDPQATRHVADLAVIDFLDGLARRHIVFVSWG